MRLNTQQLHVVRTLTCQDSEMTIVNCREVSLTKNEGVFWGCKSTHCLLLYLGSHKFMHVQTLYCSLGTKLFFLISNSVITTSENTSNLSPNKTCFKSPTTVLV